MAPLTEVVLVSFVLVALPLLGGTFLASVFMGFR